MAQPRPKIGLVIKHRRYQNNYGSALVNYAMLRLIRRLDCDCEIIQYDTKKRTSPLKKLGMLVQMLRIRSYDDFLRGRKAKLSMILHPGHAKNMAVRNAAVRRFQEEHIDPFVREYDGFENLCRGSLNYDAVVVGSDQLWTPMSLYNKYFNLLFVADEVPKISYGTSFGVSRLHPLQVKPFGDFLNRFAFVGVREQQGKTLVETVSRQPAQVVCDPTLMLSCGEWAKEIETSRVDTKEPYIFCYLLGKNPETRNAVNALKQRTGLKIIAIRHMDEYIASDERFGDEAPYDVSPLDFVNYVREARYVCTDSFHGSIFSILFHRPFAAFYRYSSQHKESRNSRIDSLLNLLGLESRICRGDLFETMEREIPYDRVEERIAELRGESLNFLTKSLEIACSQRHR